MTERATDVSDLPTKAERVYTTDDDFFADTDPSRCPECGAVWQWVRPGKAQPTCECWSNCDEHGVGMIRYHPEGEFARLSGWFCAECLTPIFCRQSKP